VDGSGAVEADADLHLALDEESAPARRDKRAIGLDRVGDRAAGRSKLAGQRDRLLVKLERDDEGLASMPDNGQRLSEATASKHVGEHCAQRVNRHMRSIGAARQVTIITIDVAKRSRLKDEQRQRHWLILCAAVPASL
jgi:hypothetical protein